MEILLAKSAGFCFGVNRAIEACYQQIQKGKTYTLGPLIHNKEVNADLQQKGVIRIDDLSEAKDGTVVIRSHGVGKEVYDELKRRGLEYIDGTCPFVKKIHEIVRQNYEAGRCIIIIGSGEHPEVQGINGWCEHKAVIIGSPEEAEEVSLEEGAYAVVVQTTFRQSKFDEIIHILKNRGLCAEIHNTICSATSVRQTEAIELSKKVDKMLIIGDKSSSNTQKLFEICKKNCQNSYYIETIHDLVLNIFDSNDKIGITAGASTPPAIIKEVISRMSETQSNAIKNEENGELSFQEMLDQSLVTLHTGDIVTGTVIQVTNEEVSVNLGYKSDGIIPRGEFSSDPNVNPSQVLQPNDKIEVFVVRVNDGDGNVLLSKKRLESMKGMDEIEKAFEEKAPVTGKVTDVVKGGVIVMVNGIRVFIPSSQISKKYVEDLSIYKGQELTFNIIELDKTKRRIIGGRKALIEKEMAEKKAVLFDKMVAGTKVTGKVSRLTDFGAFVDLGGVDGLIHISEMSWGRISSPKELLSEGQEVEVVILNVDKEKGKISLSLKDASENPWSRAEEKYALSSIVEGKVVRMVPFGAFVELEPGIDGLVHISQISAKHIAKPEDELTVGQVIKVKVLEVNAEQKKISLSKKEADTPVAEEVATEE